MTSTQVKVNRALSVPPVPFDLPLAANHRASVTIAPPSAHIGTAPIQMRLISYDLREGQVLKSSLCSHFSGTVENSIKSFIISNVCKTILGLVFAPFSVSKYLLCDLVSARFP